MTSRKKNNQPPRTKDIFKLLAWYKRKWARQEREYKAREDAIKEREKKERARKSQARIQGDTFGKNRISKLFAMDRRSAAAARKRAAVYQSNLRKLNKLNNKFRRMLSRSE